MTKTEPSSIHQFVTSLETELLPELHLESLNPHDPVVVVHLPNPWQLLGTGNYAAVVYHKDHPDFVVKIYAPGRPGFEEEVEVYRRLGFHPAFSECLYAKDGVLVLKRLQGVTLYDCIHQGLPIPKQVIQDIDEALEYALLCGLNPHDVHGRNVMMSQGRGLVVDVSDFLHTEPCTMWNHLKLGYYCPHSARQNVIRCVSSDVTGENASKHTIDSKEVSHLRYKRRSYQKAHSVRV